MFSHANQPLTPAQKKAGDEAVERCRDTQKHETVYCQEGDAYAYPGQTEDHKEGIRLGRQRLRRMQHRARDDSAMTVEPGQIWRSPDGSTVEILEIIGSLTVEARFPDGIFWVALDRFIGASSAYKFVGHKRLLAAD